MINFIPVSLALITSTTLFTAAELTAAKRRFLLTNKTQSLLLVKTITNSSQQFSDEGYITPNGALSFPLSIAQLTIKGRLAEFNDVFPFQEIEGSVFYISFCPEEDEKTFIVSSEKLDSSSVDFSKYKRLSTVVPLFFTRSTSEYHEISDALDDGSAKAKRAAFNNEKARAKKFVPKRIGTSYPSTRP